MTVNYYVSIIDSVIYNTVIKSDEILVVATRVNSLHVAWSTRNVSLIERYSILCSALKANLKVEQSVERFNDSAINSLSIGDLVPRTMYNCCVTVYSINNSDSAACKIAATLSV